MLETLDLKVQGIRNPGDVEKIYPDSRLYNGWVTSRTDFVFLPVINYR